MKLKKKEIQHFTTNEIAIIGSKSEIIVDLVHKIVKKLQKTYKIGFLEKPNFKKNNVTFDKKSYFSQLDFLFLNGNHFHSNQQILILDNDEVMDTAKSYNNIQFVIKRNKNKDYPEFLVKEQPTIKNLRSYDIADVNSISKHIENLIQEKVAAINGLILIGGKSIRMGTDKSKLDYHGKPQREFLFDLLREAIIQNNVFYSVRNNKQLHNKYMIIDKFKGLGPFGAICSAFMHNPNKAWLAIATDLPFVDEKLLKLLINRRNPSKIATTFKGKNSHFPEPLITIWEPKAYPILLYYLSLGDLSLTNILKDNDAELIRIDNKLIQNVNTKKEFDQFMKKKKLN